MKVGSMPVEAGGFGSGDPRISRRPKPGNRSRSKPVVRTSATYLSAGRTDGSCLGRRTSVACEDRTNLRIALFLARGAVSNPAAHQRPASGFHAFEPLAGGPQPQCGPGGPFGRRGHHRCFRPIGVPEWIWESRMVAA